VLQDCLNSGGRPGGVASAAMRAGWALFHADKCFCIVWENDPILDHAGGTVALMKHL